VLPLLLQVLLCLFLVAVAVAVAVAFVGSSRSAIPLEVLLLLFNSSHRAASRR
jgi:hypothetical protein